MKRIVAALTLAIAASSGIASADDDAKGLTIEARGVCVVKPPPDGNEKLCPFWMPPGTKVALLVTEPQGGLVMFDRDSSRLASFVDDQGKDLTKTENEIAVETERDASSAFPPQPALSDDHKHCSVEVSVPDVPTKQATALRLSGKIVLKLAKEKKDFAAESVPLKVGTKINAVQSPSRSNAPGKPEWGGEEGSFQVELEAKQNLDSIAGIQFFDAAGKKIGAQESSRFNGKGKSAGDAIAELLGKPADNDSVKWVWGVGGVAYRLNRKVDSVKIVITYWNDMKAVTVPFDLTVNLGL